jgi:hypothetical protein
MIIKLIFILTSYLLFTVSVEQMFAFSGQLTCILVLESSKLSNVHWRAPANVEQE